MNTAHEKLEFALELEDVLNHAFDVLSEQFSGPLRAALENGSGRIELGGDDRRTAEALIEHAKSGSLGELWALMNAWTLRLAKLANQAEHEQNET